MDGNVYKIKSINIRSEEEFELECILFLDTYQRSYDVDKIIYVKENIIYTYDKNEKVKNKKR